MAQYCAQCVGGGGGCGRWRRRRRRRRRRMCWWGGGGSGQRGDGGSASAPRRSDGRRFDASGRRRWPNRRSGGSSGAAAASGLEGGGAARPHANKRARRSCLLGHPRCLSELFESAIKIVVLFARNRRVFVNDASCRAEDSEAGREGPAGGALPKDLSGRRERQDASRRGSSGARPAGCSFSSLESRALCLVGQAGNAWRCSSEAESGGVAGPAECRAAESLRNRAVWQSDAALLQCFARSSESKSRTPGTGECRMWATSLNTVNRFAGLAIAMAQALPVRCCLVCV